MKVAEKRVDSLHFFLLLRMPLLKTSLGLICRTDKYDVAIERMGKSPEFSVCLLSLCHL